MKIMARVVFILSFMALAMNSFAAGPRAFGKLGSATTTNATITVAFHPIMFCIRNHDATNGLYFDWTDGVASTVDESTNLYLPPGAAECYSFLNSKSPGEQFLVGVRSSAGTVAYSFNATRAN